MALNIAALLVVRDEESFIERNIRYHLELGFTLVAVLDHCSIDGTSEILGKLAADERVFVTRVAEHSFDHEKLCNYLLRRVLAIASVDWIFLLDADEFLYSPGGVADFVRHMESEDHLYGSLPWFNSAGWEQHDARGPTPRLTKWFYEPWPERHWQHGGHFRKSFCRVHANMAIVVGGHYFRREVNADFFRNRQEPVQIPPHRARIFHFEFRDSAAHLYEKWSRLARFELDSSSPHEAPWLERLERIRAYVSEWETNPEGAETFWGEMPRTFWGTPVPRARQVFAPELADWFASFPAKYDHLRLERN